MKEREAIELLKKYSADKKSFNIVLKHSKAVQKLALKFAELHKKADKKFIKTACILHDIGRFRCPPGPKTLFHGIEGAKILRKNKLPKHARVAERHLGAGIKKKDIISQKLPLPKKDFIPRSIEEKIITIADSLIERNKVISLKKTVERFTREVNKECGKNTIRLYNEVCKPKKHSTKRSYPRNMKIH